MHSYSFAWFLVNVFSVFKIIKNQIQIYFSISQSFLWYVQLILSPSLFLAHPIILGLHARPLPVAAKRLCTMLHSRAAHPHAPARCAAHPAYVSAHLWLSTSHRTHCLALRTRVMCWRSSAPELLGSPVPAHILPAWPHVLMAWAHAPCHFQSPAAHDRARRTVCHQHLSVCAQPSAWSRRSASSAPCPLALPRACPPPWPAPLQPDPGPRRPTSPLRNASLQSIVGPPISCSSTRIVHVPLFFLQEQPQSPPSSMVAAH
jgi:hypothetical protein